MCGKKGDRKRKYEKRKYGKNKYGERKCGKRRTEVKGPDASSIRHWS